MALHKDQILDALARKGNVAQFVSFRPDQSGNVTQTYARIVGFPENHTFESVSEALGSLLSTSSDKTVNIRSYHPDSPRSREFVYGISTVVEATATLDRLSGDGLHLIVNETIDIHDGGVSGVVQGDTVEFAPDDTPRCVEKPGVASLPFPLAKELIRTIYGFEPHLDIGHGARLEFSIHPRPRGFRQDHTVVWEFENDVLAPTPTSLTWPNRFSRHIGDKAFGLLIAHLMGFKVPRTLVIGRRVAPFAFGADTGSSEVWLRTCPAEPHPGLFTTVKGWIDPFTLLGKEDPEGRTLASVISQAAVKADYSGAAIISARGELVVEGRRGEGAQFMLGLVPPEPLPNKVLKDVDALSVALDARFGAVRFEWVHDGSDTWIIQLHCGATTTQEGVVVPGEPKEWVEFNTEDGIDCLRTLIDTLPLDSGIILVGDVGLTSHLADILRKGQRPARLTRRPISE